MDGATGNKAASLETLISQSTSNVNEIKTKLNEIIQSGKDSDKDISSCLKSLLINDKEEIIQLSAKAVAELSKCDENRINYATKEVIIPILNIISQKLIPDKIESVRQGLRALGNLCCDCNEARKIILDNGGVQKLITTLKGTLNEKSEHLEDITLFSGKTFLNYAIGGQEFCESILNEELPDILKKVLVKELKKTDMSDGIVSTSISILSVVNDNLPEYVFETEINKTVLNVLKETTNVEISELCLDHLHMQAENDSVKTLLAKEGGVHLVCNRLELLLGKHENGDLNADDGEVVAIMKLACDLIVIVLTGDEAMNLLYNHGLGDVYRTMIKWLDSTNYELLTTGVLAIGNFARKDEYCVQMMEDKIFDKLLDIFETYHGFSVRMKNENEPRVLDEGTVTKIEHATVSAVRNLLVPASNKRAAAAVGRTARLLLDALPEVTQPHVAYKLLAALRMLVDGQDCVAEELCGNAAALAGVTRWGGAEHAGAGGEAPRVLAWAAKGVRGGHRARRIVQVDGCVACLVNMLVASHSLMQNEAILALTLLAIETLTKTTPTNEEPDQFDYENSFISQLIKSEIGKHVSVLIGTNCGKMPVEVAVNLLAFLDITSKRSQLSNDYKVAKVDESLQKFLETRSDLSDDLKLCINGVIKAIHDNAK